MSYLFVSNRQRLISFITKNENPSLSDVLESAYNYLLKCKMEIDLLKRGLQDEQKRVRATRLNCLRLCLIEPRLITRLWNSIRSRWIR